MSDETRPCRWCGRIIRLVRTPAGKIMPVDVVSDKVKLVMSDGTVRSGRLAIIEPDGRAYAGNIPHWYTCPHADEAKEQARNTAATAND